MELLYEEQNLLALQLNNSFNEISNTEIIRPSWKGNKTYGDTFFIKKRKGILASTKNIPDGDIVDSMTIDNVEYLLIFNGNNIEVAYDDGTNFVGLGLDYQKTDNTPYHFIKGKSGSGEITENITIEDAFFDLHLRGDWLDTVNYKLDNVVEVSGNFYIALRANVGLDPEVSEDDWQEYVSDESGYDPADPTSIEYRDVYKGHYLRIKLSKVNIRDKALAGTYLLFDNLDSNLQGIATEIHYVETEYNNIDGILTALPDNEVYVYITETNENGLIPYIGEEVSISTKNNYIPIIATENKIISLHTITTLGEISGAKEIEIYECKDGDEIVDLTIYNGVVFILTKETILFSRLLTDSNINIQKIDSFINLTGLGRLVPFGKILIVFGDNNVVFNPSLGTEGTDGYSLSYLHYNSNLYSKYSIIETMGSLYILQDDKQFVKLDIASDNNIDYKTTVTKILLNVRGLFDFIIGDIYINQWDGIIYILDIGAHGTYYYKYDIEYQHWDRGDYLKSFYKIKDNLYGEGLFNFNNNYFDNTSDYREQIVGFDFGGKDLHTLKEVLMVKMVFGLNEQILDYELEVEYQLGGILHTKVIDLKNYPISLEIGGGEAGLGDSNFNTTLIGAGLKIDTTAIGNFVSITVGLGLTASVFNFKIKSKENGFIYGGSIIGYVNKIPTVTEYNYKH